MANSQISKLLNFANLQIAAEAFLVEGDEVVPSPADVSRRLTRGNEHASKFTPVQAEQFVRDLEVVTQYRNDPLQAGMGTGFSATLFRCRVDDLIRGLVKDELILSFRSTEFIDDAVRDNKATNELEIKNLGWAFGQISDMEKWYATLRADPNLLAGKNFNVTGYSLGGHLATAFNILRREEYAATPEFNPVTATYTFNGAGTGSILDGRRLTDLIGAFDRIRANRFTSA